MRVHSRGDWLICGTQGHSRMRWTARTQVLFPADIYLCLEIPSWRSEYKQEKFTPAPLCKSNLSAPARWGAFIYILPAWLHWQREWIQTEHWEDKKNLAHGCNLGLVPGITILMWQLRDLHPRQRDWQKICACASALLHIRISLLPALPGRLRDVTQWHSLYLCLAHKGPQQIPSALCLKRDEFYPRQIWVKSPLPQWFFFKMKRCWAVTVRCLGVNLSHFKTER